MLRGALGSNAPLPSQQGGPRPRGLSRGCGHRGFRLLPKAGRVIAPALWTTWTPAQQPVCSRPHSASPRPLLSLRQPEGDARPLAHPAPGPAAPPSAVSPAACPWPCTPPHPVLRNCSTHTPLQGRPMLVVWGRRRDSQVPQGPDPWCVHQTRPHP